MFLNITKHSVNHVVNIIAVIAKTINPPAIEVNIDLIIELYISIHNIKYTTVRDKVYRYIVSYTHLSKYTPSNITRSIPKTKSFLFIMNTF